MPRRALIAMLLAIGSPEIASAQIVIQLPVDAASIGPRTGVGVQFAPAVAAERDRFGITVIVGSAAGAITLSAIGYSLGASDDQPRVGATVFGIGAGLGALAGAAIGRRKAGAAWTVLGAVLGTIPLVIAAEPDDTASPGLEFGIAATALLPILGAWLGNVIAQ
jgi:hypothetical protein